MMRNCLILPLLLCLCFPLWAEPGHTLSVRIDVNGNPEAVSVRRYGQFTDIPAAEFADVVLDPAVDLPLTVRSSVPGHSLHSVAVNGSVQPVNYDGYYTLGALSHGDVIAVNVNAPQRSVALAFAFLGQADQEVVKRITVDGADVEMQPEGIVVAGGSAVALHLNHDDYDVKGVALNGVPLSATLPQFAVGLDEDALLLTIEAAKLPPYRVTVFADPDAVRLYCPENDRDYGLQHGLSTEVEVKRSMPSLAWEPRTGFALDRVENGNGETVAGGRLEVSGDCTLRFFTRRQAADRSFWLYTGQFDSGELTIGHRHIDLTAPAGYRQVDYSPYETPLAFTFSGMAVEPAVYKNGALLEREYGCYPDLADLPEHCAVKVFSAPAEMHSVQVVNPDGIELTVTADRAYVCQGPVFQVAGPTELLISSPQPFTATANGQAMKDGTAEINGRTVIRVMAGNASVCEPDATPTRVKSYRLNGLPAHGSDRGILIKNNTLIIQ